VRTALTAWGLKKGDIYRIGHYTIGWHAKALKDSPYLWSHIHLAVAVDRLCPYRNHGGLTEYLTEAYEHALDITPAPKVVVQNFGILTYSRTTSPSRKGKLKVCQIEHAINHFAYVMRNDEDDDTATSIESREALLCSISAGQTAIHSRRSGNAAKKRMGSLPHEFDPQKLGKANCVVFPFDGSEHRLIPAENYRQELTALKLEATQLVDSILS